MSSTTGYKVRIILAYDARLVREMWRRVLSRSPQFKIVGEVGDLSQVAPILTHSGAEWVIVSLTPDGQVPSIVHEWLDGHAALHVLAMAADSSAIRFLPGVTDGLQGEVLSVDEVLAIFQADACPR
ncbi:MAG: hypothetical protein R6W76_19790 [Caldilinea sp.]